MSYATQQNLLDRFGETELVQLTDRLGSGLLDTALVTQALADADDTINGYLSGKYELPFASAPKVLNRLACDLARYFLYADQATEQVAKRHDDAIAFLKSVAAGTVKIGLDQNDETPSGDAPEYTAPERTFTRTTLADY